MCAFFWGGVHLKDILQFPDSGRNTNQCKKGDETSGKCEVVVFVSDGVRRVFCTIWVCFLKVQHLLFPQVVCYHHPTEVQLADILTKAIRSKNHLTWPRFNIQYSGLKTNMSSERWCFGSLCYLLNSFWFMVPFFLGTNSRFIFVGVPGTTFLHNPVCVDLLAF